MGMPGLYLLRIESFPDESGDPERLGFDAAVEFEPRWSADLKQPMALQVVGRLRQPLAGSAPFCPHVRSYNGLAHSEAARPLS